MFRIWMSSFLRSIYERRYLFQCMFSAPLSEVQAADCVWGCFAPSVLFQRSYLLLCRCCCNITSTSRPRWMPPALPLLSRLAFSMIPFESPVSLGSIWIFTSFSLDLWEMLLVVWLGLHSSLPVWEMWSFGLYEYFLAKSGACLAIFRCPICVSDDYSFCCTDLSHLC